MKVIDAITKAGAFVTARAKEPSSAAGLAAVLAAVGVGVPTNVIDGGLQAAAAVFGLVGIVRKEVNAVQGKDVPVPAEAPAA